MQMHLHYFAWYNLVCCSSKFLVLWQHQNNSFEATYSLLPLSLTLFFCSKRENVQLLKMSGPSIYLQCWWERQWQSQAVWCLAVKHLLCYCLVPTPVCVQPNWRLFWVNLSFLFPSGSAEYVRLYSTRTVLAMGHLGIEASCKADL